jgi:ppGpp synthetase/RelA/SpoT-type nucleotidyltranferase
MEKKRLDIKMLKIHEDEYKSIYSIAYKFCDEVKKQINELLEQNQISLAFPIECRVKAWSSLLNKIKEKAQDIKSVKEVHDLVGLRIILLFLRELPKVCQLLENNFKIIEKEDTITRLRENEFGYLSLQYIIELPESWFTIPTFAPLNGFRSEVQVRTAAQHIWAAASHKLQYKKESGVPIPIRRSIHRVSALLETVDLELDRVLDNRSEYIEKFSQDQDNDLLNVDLLKHIFDMKMPKNNLDIDEKYADLLEEFLHFEVNTPSKLNNLLDKHIKAILDKDANVVREIRADPDTAPYSVDNWERIKRGVFYAHTGLARQALEFEFGEKWMDYFKDKSEEEFALEP